MLYVLEINSLKKKPVLNRERDLQSVEALQGLAWGWNETWLYTGKLIQEFAWIICLANKKSSLGITVLVSFIPLVSE